MSKSVEAFSDAIQSKIEYFRKEYELTLAEAVGCLEIAKHQLIQEQMEGE